MSKRESYAMEMLTKMVGLRVLITLLGFLGTVALFALYIYICQGADIIRVIGFNILLSPIMIIPTYIGWYIGKNVWLKQKDMLRAKLRTMR